MDASKQPQNPIDVAEEIVTSCITLMRAKNNDYAGTADFFKNLTMVEKFGITDTEHGILVRMTDKFSRVATLLDPNIEQKVKDESIEDTLKDIVNYSLLLMVYRRLK